MTTDNYLHQLGRAVCKALGVDDKQTRGVVVRFYASEVVTATVEHILTPGQCDAVIQVLEAVDWRGVDDGRTAVEIGAIANGRT